MAPPFGRSKLASLPAIGAGDTRTVPLQEHMRPSKSPRSLAVSLTLLALAFSASFPAFAAGELPTATASASASGAPVAGPLPELPRLAPITFPEADAASLKELDRILEALTGEEDRLRANARTCEQRRAGEPGARDPAAHPGRARIARSRDGAARAGGCAEGPDAMR